MYKILDFLEDRTLDALSFFDVFVRHRYGAGSGHLDYRRRENSEAILDYQMEREKRRKLQKYVYKLKQDGLISENQTGKIFLSKKGKEKLQVFKKQDLINKDSYREELGEKIIIVSYDIPTDFNKKRDNLREILKMIGFYMVHKSVWVGKVKLPKNFAAILSELNILEYVEVLEVTKYGTLKHYY